MRVYERNGVTIDQCTGCRGVFLDRGELERLIDAEAAYTAALPPVPPREQYRPEWGGRGDHRDSGSYHGDRRRKKGFLGELFD